MHIYVAFRGWGVGGGGVGEKERDVIVRACISVIHRLKGVLEHG